jgi:hypothetical protein
MVASAMMLVFFWSTSERTHELLPCGLQWRKLVKLFRKKNSKFFWFFAVRGERYRGSTQVTDEKRATTIASLKLAKALENSDPPGPQGAQVYGSFRRGFLGGSKRLGLSLRHGVTTRTVRDSWNRLRLRA